MTAPTLDTRGTVAPVKPFGFKDKIGYMFGDFGNNIQVAMVNFVFLKFYTDVMDLSAALVGSIMTVVAIATIFANIVIGQLVDRSPLTPRGKFRPWILRMAGPFAVSTVLLFANWLSGADTAVKLAWMVGTYVLWLSVMYGSMEIPYGAMAAVITPDPDDRMRLSNFRNLGGTFGMSLVSIVLPLTVYYTDADGNSVLSGSRMMYFALGVGVLAVTFYLLLYFLTTERVTNHKPVTDRPDLRAIGKAIVTNKALIVIVFVVLLRELSNTSLQGMASFMYANYFSRPAVQSIADLCSTGLALLAFTFMARIGIRFGKKETVAAGCLLITTSMVIALTVQTDNPFVWVGFYLVNTLGIMAFGALGWAFITDLIDDMELRTGSRSEGTIASVWNMSMQIGQAISSLVIGFMLTGIGYTSATKFDPDVVHRLYNIACIVPAAGFLLTGLVLIFFYPLSKKRVDENAALLKERRDAEQAAAV